MGLDNIPNQYPCKAQGIAILDDDNRIDCEATQKAGNCPYVNIKSKDPLLANKGGVLGMFGTDCWYRGKYGNYLLGVMENHNSNFGGEMISDFYGLSNDDDEGIDPDTCIEMSMTMNEYAEDWVRIVNTKPEFSEYTKEQKEELILDWAYAAWWLKFVGENCNGSNVWY